MWICHCPGGSWARLVRRPQSPAGAGEVHKPVSHGSEVPSVFGGAESHLVHRPQAACPLCPHHCTAAPAPCPSWCAQPRRLQRGFAWTSKACRRAGGLSLISPLGFTRENGSSCSKAAIYSFALKAMFLAESKALAVNLGLLRWIRLMRAQLQFLLCSPTPAEDFLLVASKGPMSRQWAVGWRQVLGWTRFHCKDPR